MPSTYVCIWCFARKPQMTYFYVYYYVQFQTTKWNQWRNLLKIGEKQTIITSLWFKFVHRTSTGCNTGRPTKTSYNRIQSVSKSLFIIDASRFRSTHQKQHIWIKITLGDTVVISPNFCKNWDWLIRTINLSWNEKSDAISSTIFDGIPGLWSGGFVAVLAE